MNSSPPDDDWRHLLTADERAFMLADIARVSLAVGRQSFPERSWDDLDITAGSLASHKSPLERLRHIEHLLPDLTHALAQIAQRPLTQAAKETRMIAPPARARHVPAAAIFAAVRRGHAERFWEEQATTWSPDTAENRAVKAFLKALCQDVAAIGEIAEAAEETEINSAAHRAAGRLRGLAALPLWAEVTEDARAWWLPQTQRMGGDVRYARLAEAMRRYRRSFQFDWSQPLFSLPPRETWRLYETWGLFQVLDALLVLGHIPELAANTAVGALFAVHQDRLTFALVKGTESRLGLAAPDGRRVALFYNRSYPQQTRSRSRTMQPDITIERSEQTWVLDPKFKAYAEPGSEGNDIDQMHAYRDAIVSAKGEKVVMRAWCLFCGEADGARPEISYGPSAASIVGALRLRPGDSQSFARLCRLLAEWLG